MRTTGGLKNISSASFMRVRTPRVSFVSVDKEGITYNERTYVQGLLALSNYSKYIQEINC